MNKNRDGFLTRLQAWSKKYWPVFAIFAAVLTGAVTLYRYFESPLVLVIPPVVMVGATILFIALKRFNRSRINEPANPT